MDTEVPKQAVCRNIFVFALVVSFLAQANESR